MKDQEIIERIQKGDETALDYLYTKNYRVIARYVTSNSGSADEAKDLFQDGLIVFWQKAASGNLVMTSKISTFLFSICKNLWRKELSKKARKNDSDVPTADYIDYEQKERADVVEKAISKLGETCQKVLMYYYFDKMSMQDIADKLGFASANTAKTKKYKCKNELEKIVRAEYEYKDFWD